MDFLQKLELYLGTGEMPKAYAPVLHHFYESYSHAIKTGGFDLNKVQPVLCRFLDTLVEQIKNPYTFELFHKRVRAPFDYYQFGMDFFRPLINFSESRILGISNLETIMKLVSKGENAILLANHQIEPDPQIISLLLENHYPQLAEEMIFVAGHRVTTDPMAIPFSLGRNLLCIYSKKYIDHPPEQKEQKLQHNQKTMKKMSQLLSEGGKCIYVAPSGGRDRPDEKGELDIAPFDANSIEMFRLMAQQADRPTHFFPLALLTYHISPPPKTIQKELGEQRPMFYSPAHLAFGGEIDMDNFPGSDTADKKEKRQLRTNYIEKHVREDYRKIFKLD